jgi:hypothetical protein
MSQVLSLQRTESELDEAAAKLSSLLSISCCNEPKEIVQN